MSHLQVDFVPCPNWFCPQIMDASLQGQLAYGCRGKIVVFDIHAKPKLRLTFPAHEDKVTCLSFCKKNAVFVLASGGEDGQLKIWDVENNPMLICFCSFERKKISAVEFKYGSSDKVFFALGFQLKAYSTNMTQWKTIKTFAKEDIILLASCPSNPNLLVAGHKYGLISMYDTDTLKSLYKLHGHTMDITYVSWRAFSETQVLTSSMDGSIRLWTRGEGMEEVTSAVYNEYPLPKKESKFKKGVIACFHPSDPNLFVVGNNEGVVSLYDISEDVHKRSVLSKGFGGHDKCILSMVPNYSDPNFMITYSLDRQIIFWDLSLKKSAMQLSSIFSSIQCVDISPHDNFRLAIGCADSSIRIWDTSQNASSRSYHAGLRSRVTAVAWHPEKEGTLAFSDEDGRIGLFATAQGHKGISFLARRHQGNVYGLCWGLCKLIADTESQKQNYYLFSCGEGRIYIHFLDNAKPGVDFEKLITSTSGNGGEKTESRRRTAICWKPDYSLFTVGSDGGMVEIYDSEFHLMASLRLGKLRIQSLKWHPDFISLSPARCTMHCWLAVASNSRVIHVYDLADVLDPKVKKPHSISESTRLLKGHSSEVTEFSWSPHVLGHLASSSFDHTVRVWDVVSGQLLVIFPAHEGRVFTVKWSCLDPDVIFSAGEDCFLFRWRVSEQTNEIPEDKKEKLKALKEIKKTFLAGKSTVNGVVSEKELEEEKFEVTVSKDSASGDKTTEEEEEEVKGSIENRAREIVYELPVSEKCSKPRGAAYAEKNKRFCAFRLVSEGLNQKRTEKIQDTLQLLRAVNNGPNDTEILGGNQVYLGLFAQDALFYRTFESEVARAKNDSSCLPVVHFELWKGNIKEHILNAIEKEELDDYLVSLSPLVSRAFWLEVCEKYAIQCVTEKRYAKAVSSYLVCGKIYEAIKALRDSGNFRDALGLAKVRLHHSDPIVTEIQDMWAEKLTLEFKLEPAAKCYIGLRQPLKAAKVIYQKGDSQAAELAARICHSFGENVEAKMYIRKALFQCLQRNKWESAEECLQLYPEFEGLTVIVKVHKTLVELLKVKEEDKENVSGLVAGHVCSEEIPQEDTVLWKCCTVDGQSFLQHLYSCFFIGVDTDSPSFKTSVLEVEAMLMESHRQHTFEVLFEISLSMTSFFFSFLSCEDKSKFDIEGYLTSFLCISTQGDSAFAQMLHQLLFPFNVIWNVNEKKIKLFAVTSEKGGDIDILTSAVCEKMNCLSVFQTQQYMGNVDFIHNGEYFCNKNQMETLCDSTSHVESLLGFFSIYFFHTLKGVLYESGWFPPCLEEPEKSEVKDIHYNDEDIIGSQDTSVADENCQTKQPHMHCYDSALLILQLCKVFAACVCKDAFAIEHFLGETVEKFGKSLLYLRLERKKMNLGCKESDSSDTNNKTTEELVENTEANTDRALEANTDRALEASTDRALEASTDRALEASTDTALEASTDTALEASTDTALETSTNKNENTDQMQIFVDIHQHYLTLQTEFMEKVKGKYLPDCIPAVTCILGLLNSIEEKVTCPDVKQDLTSFVCQLKLWNKKFLVSPFQ